MNKMSREKLTIIIPTFNVEKIIRDCLESVKWADEIIVCDSFSTDTTLEICREFTEKIIQHEYINSALQKNWAIPQASNEWVMIVDSDEIVTPELRDEIIEILKTGVNTYSGFRVPRRPFFLGKEIKYAGWTPDLNLRLFQKSKGKYEEKEVHADVKVSGSVANLKNALVHYSFPSISHCINKWNRYAGWEAVEMKKNNRSFSWFDLLLRPPMIFFLLYFIRKGYREGTRGFFISVFTAFYYFLKFAKLWEVENLKTG